MTPAMIIQKAAADGVTLSLSPAGKIKLAGPESVVNYWLPAIREHKPEIITILQETNAPAPSIDAYGMAVALQSARPDVRAETLMPTTPTSPMTDAEETAIRAWLYYVNDPDPTVDDEVLAECRVNPYGKQYFLYLATDLPRPGESDTRPTCAQCASLAPSGHCHAAQRGEIFALEDFMPVAYLHLRCAGFTPKSDDQDDQLPDGERWPQLH